MKSITKRIGLMLLALALPLCVYAQSITVKGTVKDSAGEPVIGASIIQEGTTNGVITDLDGNYSIFVPSSASIKVSCIGYADQVIAVKGQSTINVVLADDAEFLEEVVVVGYGTMKKSDLTGSVASVDKEAMMKKAPQNIGQALQGAAAGVIVTLQDGSPDANAAVRIRGVATINGSAAPLYVVDGVQVGTDANFLNPQDIERIEVLKDASATAIYGSAGANGVIMITTKHGEKGRTHVTATVDFGVQTLPYRLDVLDIDTFAASVREAKANDGAGLYNQVWDSIYDGKRNEIDWQTLMTRPAVRQQYGVSINGGNDKTQYTASAGYLNNDGLIVNSNYRRFTARANVRSKVTKFLELGVDMNYVHSESHGSNAGYSNNGNLSSLRDLAFMSPTLDYVLGNAAGGTLINVNPVNPDGTYGATYQDTADGWEGNTVNFTNPYGTQMEAGERARRGNDRFMVTGNVGLTLLNSAHHKIVLRNVSNWTYWGNNSADMTGGHHRYNIISGDYKEIALKEAQKYVFSMNHSSGYSSSVETYLTYNMNFKNHSLTAMVGNTVSQSEGQWQNGSAEQFLSVDNRQISLTEDPDQNQVGGGFNADIRGISYYGRLVYSLMDKYVLTATFRRDGSSNFGSGNRWGNFPSFAAAWKISKEPWMQNINWLSNLKLRASWGQAGNAGGMTGKAIAALTSANVAYNFYPENAVSGAFGGNRDRQVGIYAPLVDTNLKWETNESLDFGVDFGLWNDTLTGSVDYFVRTAKDLLLYQQTRPSTGYSSVYTNYGSIENKGIEISLTYKKQFSRDWGMTATLNASTLKNKVIQMGEPLYYTNDGSTNDGSNVGAIMAPANSYWGQHSISMEGEAIGSFYGYKVGGIIKDEAFLKTYNDKLATSTSVGDFWFEDLDGNGYIDENDRTILGNGFPKFNYGLNITATFRNWDFSLFANGVLGQQIFSYSAMRLSNTLTSDDQTFPNILRSSYDACYRKGNEANATLPQLKTIDTNHNCRASDFWVKNGDFFRLSNLQVGYTFNQPWLKNINVSSARVYFATQNLFTISPYMQYGDPEVGQGSVLVTGLDTGRYPMPRTFMAGLSVTF